MLDQQKVPDAASPHTKVCAQQARSPQPPAHYLHPTSAFSLPGRSCFMGDMSILLTPTQPFPYRSSSIFLAIIRHSATIRHRRRHRTLLLRTHSNRTSPQPRRSPWSHHRQRCPCSQSSMDLPPSWVSVLDSNQWSALRAYRSPTTGSPFLHSCPFSQLWCAALSGSSWPSSASACGASASPSAALAALAASHTTYAAHTRAHTARRRSSSQSPSGPAPSPPSRTPALPSDRPHPIPAAVSVFLLLFSRPSSPRWR